MSIIDTMTKTTYTVMPTVSERTYRLVTICYNTEDVLETLKKIIKWEFLAIHAIEYFPQMFVAVSDIWEDPVNSKQDYTLGYKIYHKRYGQIAYIEVKKEIKL